MQSAKRYLVIGLSFAVCLTVFAAFTPRIAHAITATLVQVVNTASNPVPTSMATHLGQPAANLVTLSFNSLSDRVDEILPNGQTVEWTTTPAGQVLVVTDYSWVIQRATPSRNVQFTLENDASPNFAVVDQDVAMSDADGVAGGSRQAIIAFPAGTKPRVEAPQFNAFVAVVLHGYLAPQ